MSIRQLDTAARWTGDEVRIAANLATHAENALRGMGDERGAAAARGARESLRSPRVTLVVAGEFQQGKSSVVNALLKARVSPTDPLGTTSVPIRVSWGKDNAWWADLSPTGGSTGAQRRQIRSEQFDLLATSGHPALDDRVVSGLGVAFDHPLLRCGITLIDTPCIGGGLSTQTVGVVLGLLQAADGLVFVTDASQELTAPEVEFLRMARTLCPALVVVLSKVDLYPDWRRLLDIDQERVTACDPTALVLPTSSQLRATAVRYDDADLDRESGFPLLIWYLGTTMLTEARQAAVRRCGVELTAHLSSAIEVVTQRLDVLNGSTGRQRTEEQYQQVLDRLRMLRSEAPRRVRSELGAFTRATSSDLAKRFAAVSLVLADFIKTVDPADQWGEIEATMRRAANRALADHIAHVRARAEFLVTGLNALLRLEDLSVELDEPGPAPMIGSELDPPDFSTERASRVHDMVRSAVSTGFMGVGLATTVLTGGLSAVALGAGASVSTVVLSLRRERTRDVEMRRARALQTCRSWVDEARTSVIGYADDVYKEWGLQLEGQIERGLRSAQAKSEAELVHLEELRRVAAENVPEELSRARRQLEHLRLVHAHARRTDHRHARPELRVVSR